MKNLIFFGAGILFGMLMYLSEAASWFRIYEMFQFDSFHMYGIIGSALVVGVGIVQWIKKREMKDAYGKPIKISPKNISIARYALGGIIFGLGWALAGACPGPIFTLLGAGYGELLIVFASAILGTFLYGWIKDYLPH